MSHRVDCLGTCGVGSFHNVLFVVGASPVCLCMLFSFIVLCRPLYSGIVELRIYTVEMP